MPVYEYGCKACGHEFEREQRISDDPIKKCPKCGAAKARRLISRTSFVLKGGGWYNDLYASPGAKKAGGEEKAGGDSPAAAEPKPAADAASTSGDNKPAEPPPSGSGGGPKKGGKGGKGAKAAA